MLRPGSDAKRVLSAISKSQALIEFDMNGVVMRANENFCAVLGYSETELLGKHHSIFCDAAVVESDDYLEFWSRLRSGLFDTGTYLRLGKGGRKIWIQASYNPVFRKGKPYKIVKFAADITELKERAIEDSGKLNAISRSQAVIEFTPAGEIITANQNFCDVMGYTSNELVGKHHRIFCKADYIKSKDYSDFWDRLTLGKFIANEFVRLRKDGQDVWIQAAYNPIFDSSGKVCKVIKFATDVTERMQAIAQVNEEMEAISNGDLTVILQKEFVPSMETMRHNFNRTVNKLKDAMLEVEASASVIANGSREISNASESFAKRTEQQAASLEETAAALEQITTGVHDSSTRAREAGALVLKAKLGAEQAGAIVDKAVAAMDEIDQSSKSITSILTVIDDIAFQTNLLALNAGIEAARAGSAGKGFAVVAQEVRELAQRSAAAASDINVLINSSNAIVERGVTFVGQTGQSLKEIVSQVVEIDRNISAIVEAAREQSVGLKEVNIAVNSMDQATQQNAAMVEESAAASVDLTAQAAALKDLLLKFHIHEESAEMHHITYRKAG